MLMRFENESTQVRTGLFYYRKNQILESAYNYVTARSLDTKHIVFSWSALAYAHALWKSVDASTHSFISP